MEARERVISKSVELFTQNGIRLVTMDQIAAEVGMSKRTIYEMFRDKDQLLEECLKTLGHKHEEEIREIIANSDNVIEALLLIGRHGERKKSGYNRLFFEDLRRIYPTLWEKMREETRPGEGSVSYAILIRGIEEGIFREEIDVAIVDIFIHAMMETLGRPDAFPSETSVRDLTFNIVIPYFKGISTRKGQRLIEKHFPFQTS